MYNALKLSTATQAVKVGPVVDNTGAWVTSGVIADFQAAKNGGALAALHTATIAYDAAGIYTITLDATDTNTAGRLVIQCVRAATICPPARYQVVAASIYSALVDASTKLPITVAVGDITGGAVPLPASGSMPETANTNSLPQKTAKEQYCCSGTVWHVATSGNNGTGDGLSWPTAYATVNQACRVAAAGDLILVGPGTFWLEAGSLVVPDGVSLLGAGPAQTILTAYYMDTAPATETVSAIKPGSNAVLKGFTIQGSGCAGKFWFPIGCLTGESPFTNLLLEDVWIFGDADGLFVNSSASPCSATLRGCRIVTHYDAVNLGPASTTAHDLTLIDCAIRVIPPYPSMWAMRGIVANKTAQIRVYGGEITIAGTTSGQGVVVSDSGTAVYLFGVAMYCGNEQAGATGSDLYTNGDGSAIYAVDCVYNRTKTSGTHITDVAPGSTDKSGIALATPTNITGGTITTVTTLTNAVTLAASQTNYAPAKAGDKMDLIDAPNATARSALAASVWSYLCTAADALGVTTIGGWLRSQLNAVFGRVSAAPIQVLSLVQPGGSIELEQYASYKAARNNALAIAVNVAVDLTGADVHLLIAAQQAGTPVMPPVINISNCTVVGPRTAATGLSADIPSASTALLTSFNARAYAWCFVAYYPTGGDQIPLTEWSDCTVTPGVALTS